jgi:DNA-binding PadR family transcriptional regulator
MRSPLNWALLGLVIQRPSYGYELVQRFERTYEDSLELSSPSQIYTGLDMLVRRSLIEEFPPEDMAHPHAIVRQPKPHYRATARGVREYQEWLIAHVREERRRSRLFTCQLAALGPSAALGLIERYQRACLEEASRMPVVDREGSHAEDAIGLTSRLVAEIDRLAMGARLEWIEYARRELTAITRRTDEQFAAS